MTANDRTTLASLLKRNGCNTAMSVKWHMGMTFADNGKGPKAENDTPVKLPWKTN